MLERLHAMLKGLERRARGSFGRDMSTPWGRALVWLNFNLFDHAFLRTFWTNFDKVADGVYRSNHPGPRRLARWKADGIKGVLNLRGANKAPPWLLEKGACDRLGLDLRVAKIYARKAAQPDELLSLIQAMRDMPKPFVMHCKSGADRAGLAAALYALVIDGQPLTEARKHLSWRYLHSRATRTGIVDHILDHYEARADQDKSFEDWLRSDYDPAIVKQSFRRLPRGTAGEGRIA
ncbi:MAG: tyrosine-protein phosphatase [Pseudomonadota bacterium]